MKKTRIFIVEDEALIAMELKDRLEHLGYEVCGTAARGEEAVARVPEARPDLVLMDIRLAGVLDGIETAGQLRERIAAPLVYVSAHADTEILERAKVSEPFGFLVKPFNERELRATIEMALYKHRTEAQLKESEQQYRLLFESAGDGIFIIDAEGPEAGRIVTANRSAAAMHGYMSEELVRLKIIDIDAPDAAAAVPTLIERMLRGEWIKQELMHRRKDGSEFPVEISAGVMEREGHKYILAFDRDISDRKLAEKTLQQTMEIQSAVNAILRLSLSGANIDNILQKALEIILAVPSLSFESQGSIFLADQKERVLKLTACEGLPEDLRTLCGRLPFGKCLCGQAAELKQVVFASDIDKRHENVYAGMSPHGHYCVPILHGDDLLGVFTIYLKPRHQRLPYEEDFLKAVADTLAGVIIRKQTADAINESESKFRALFNLSTDGIFIVDAEGRFIDVNQTAHERLGYTKEELLTLGIRQLDAPEFAARVPERIQKLMKEGQIIFESAHMKKDGTIMPVEINSRVIDFEGQHALFSVIRDITERKQAEQALKKREAQLLESQRIAHIGSWERDLISNKITWSEEMFRIFGLDAHATEPSFQAFQDTIHPDDRGRFTRVLTDAISSGKPYSTEFRIIRPDGSERTVSVLGEIVYDQSGRSVLIRGTMQDITERKRVEDERQKLQLQLAQAQKMETVGQLAGGVAHDFNNILTAIMGDTYLLNMKMDKGNPLLAYVQDILASAERAANLTQGLLAFSRKQLLNPKPLDLNALITKLHRLTARLIGEDIDYRTDLSQAPLTVIADSGQLEQVLMNLITNARDAMHGGGTLSVATRPARFDKTTIDAQGFGAPGSYALIEVSDSGEGMDEQVREKIFEPFFTTKEVGKGTGLGLAIVYGVVKQHNGFIICDSAPRKGTTFKIYLPTAESSSKAIQQAAALPQQGTECILVAEDDAMVRKTTTTILEQFGYRVIEAIDGEDAVQKFSENRDAIKLVMMDVVMPKKNGKESAEEITRILPDAKILFTSGYTNEIIHAKGILDEHVNFLPKMSSPVTLLNKVREILDR